MQRVKHSSVEVDGRVVGEINTGLLLLLGIESEDDETDIDWLIRKVINMRIFPDDNGNMNISVQDVDGGLLVVSQFTLHASTKKGNRPSFVKAADPDVARSLYNKFLSKLQANFFGEIATGEFGAMMNVNLTNDGPVTIWLDTKNKE